MCLLFFFFFLFGVLQPLHKKTTVREATVQLENYDTLMTSSFVIHSEIKMVIRSVLS